jgi:hypothetical protein
MEAVWVELDEDERDMIEARAKIVVEEDIAAGYKMKFDSPTGETRLEINIRGFGAELAASKATGLRWNHELLDTKTYAGDKPADIGRRVEVKNALSQSGRLPGFKGEPIERVYLLVVGDMPRFRVVGWMEGVDLHRPERWVEPKGRIKYAAFFAAQGDLRRLPLPSDA